MPRTPDQYHGERHESSLKMLDEGQGLSDEEGRLRYSGGRFSLRDATGEYDPRAGGGLSETQHRGVDQLVHAIAENSYEEISYTGNKVDSIVVWASVAKTTKIREELFTYTGSKVTTIVTKQYDGAGALVAGETMTETLTYSGNKVTSTTRVLS